MKKTTNILAAAALFSAALATHAGAQLIPINTSVRPVITFETVTVGGETHQVFVTNVTVADEDGTIKTSREFVIPGDEGSEKHTTESTITVQPDPDNAGMMLIVTSTTTTTTPISEDGVEGEPEVSNTNGSQSVPPDEVVNIVPEPTPPPVVIEDQPLGETPAVSGQ